MKAERESRVTERVWGRLGARETDRTLLSAGSFPRYPPWPEFESVQNQEPGVSSKFSTWV